MTVGCEPQLITGSKFQLWLDDAQTIDSMCMSRAKDSMEACQMEASSLTNTRATIRSLYEQP